MRAAGEKGNGSEEADRRSGDAVGGENDGWGDTYGVPSYLRSKEYEAFCLPEGKLDFERMENGTASEECTRGRDGLWEAMCAEAAEVSRQELILSSFLYTSILAHKSFEKALSFVLSNRLQDATLLSTQLNEIFSASLTEDPSIGLAARSDIVATHERDPACRTLIDALLYFKGYQSIQCVRIAHHLWNKGDYFMAQMLQSRISEVYAVDIHPAANFGSGILLDHATGVVIGETARVGDNCSIMQGVTLGGTGKDTGDRHPKVGKGVLIGPNATVLGNIRIGRGAMIAAGSLVLKSVPDYTMVAGAPAVEVGRVPDGTIPSIAMQQKWTDVSKKRFCDEWEASVREMIGKSSPKADDDFLATSI